MTTENALINTIATIRDISHFRQADELKSEFVSTSATSAQNTGRLIKAIGNFAPGRRSVGPQGNGRKFEVIEEEADRLTELIEDLLDASQLQVGAMQLKRTDIAIGPFIQRIADKFQVQTQSHQIVVEIPEDFPVVIADEVRLQQVISNLISNSIKYASEGEIRITGEVRSETVIICVTDEGPGIARCDMPHIFDRFYRAQETSRKTKGTGLGLYLARSIIEAHNGRMWADPTRKKGARICFSLPRDED